MAPTSSLPPSSSVGSKKQQTISSFFTRKPAATAIQAHPNPAPPLPPPPQPTTTNSSSDDDDAPVSRKNNSRQRKRTVGHEDSDSETSTPQPKKAKIIPPHAKRSPERPALSERSSVNHVNASQRTSKYLFSKSPVQVENLETQPESDDEQVRKQKAKLHERFVKKLGRPDAIAEIKRRNHFITEENGEDNPDDEDAEEEGPPPRGRKAATLKKGGQKLTPMEKQVIQIKTKHMDTLLVVEVGYKFRFFGEDARTAAKELGIVCIPGKFRFDEHPSEAHLDKFASASIPTHRLHVHVRRLVDAGHKVGVVRQLETAALKKAGDNRNAPFVRQLTNVYTKATYIDDTQGLDEPASGNEGAPSSGYILCLTETNANGWSTDEKVHIGLVAVQPATGDIVYDDFEDGFLRSEIETRLLHIAPVEFLIVGELSRATEKIVAHLSGSKTNVFGDQARVERVPKSKTMAAEAFSHISSFYADKMKATESTSQQERNSATLDKVHQLAEHVTVCLSAMIKHMKEYGLEHVFDLTKYFQPFSARSHMLLNGNTLTSLEVYLNQTDLSEKGSLFWCMNRTKTKFGHRLLRRWVGRPLLDKARLEERVNAIEELKENEHSAKVDKLRYLLGQIRSDLEKSLIRIYYKKASRPELLAVLQTLQRIATEYAAVTSPEKAEFESRMISEAIANLPKISDDVIDFLERINPQAAKADDKYCFFREPHETEDMQDHQLAIASIEDDLNDHRAVAAEKIKKKKVEYVTVSGIEYLIEVENNYVKNVPASWIKISGTKKVSRFHTPEVLALIRERDRSKEALAAACDDAFTSLLSDIGSKYQQFRDCVQSLATLDCLLSLAEVASQPGYNKPTFTTSSESITIKIEGGRHPMVEQLLLDSYVPNSTLLSQDPSLAPRALLITGPNMGGKSSYVRSVALICIMAQIGSYVPADSASVPLLDAVFTRMGAFDNMMKGESTFMVELNETSDILKQATSRSLVILDELGRGTSTHDGVAIAMAVLDHVVRDLKALTLFITHYQSLSRVSSSFPHGELKNVHMRFTETTQATSPLRNTEGESDRIGNEEITFLYEVGDGVAHRSYGLNVARLANVPEPVLRVAKEKSEELEGRMREAAIGNLAKMFRSLLKEEDRPDEEERVVEELEAIVEGMERL